MDWVALAPLCQECGKPVQRTEIPWHQDEDGVWRPVATMVCPDGHRRVVSPVFSSHDE